MKKTSTAAEHDKTKIFLLCGFLGSGKTTLLKRILSWESDLSGTVVLVNEFGKVGIDGAILKRAGSDVIELTSGCICCTIKTELAQTLKDVSDRFNPKRILLEATGVAEPDAVASVLKDYNLKQGFEIQKIITVLDIKFWIAREVFGQFFMNQIEQADLILLNKIDLADENIVTNSLREIHEAIKESHIVPTIYCEVDPETLWVQEHRKTSGSELFNFYRPAHSSIDDHEHDLHNHSHDDQHHGHTKDENAYVAFDFSESQPLSETCFKSFLEQVPWELFRIKGPVKFTDRTMLLNFVGGRSDWEAWDDDQNTSLAFVGWRVNGNEVIEQLKRCVLTE